MRYTPWDIETSNQFCQFEDERDVLALVRALVNHYGPRYADDLGLGRVTARGVILEPLSGEALISRVEAVLSGHESADEDPFGLAAPRGRNHEIA